MAKKKETIKALKEKRIYRRGNQIAIIEDRRCKPQKMKKPKGKVPEALKKHQFKKGNKPPKKEKSTGGITLLQRVREMLLMKSRDESGKFNTNLDQAAIAYIQQMKAGSFAHLKEILDREEGKSPLKNPQQGENVKWYVGIPVDGPDAP
jgi:hypothetical protein